MEGNLTKGPILKTLTKLAVPIMASSFLGTLYNITDMAWIGLLGSKAVAGVGVGGMFTWFSQGLASMSRMGGQVQVAQCIGRGDREEAHKYAQTAVQLATLMGLLFAAVMLLFLHPLVGFFQLQDPEALQAALSYTKIACGLIVFSFLTLTLTGIYTAQGDSKTPFIANFIGLVTNMILDPLLILGLGPVNKFGVNGAAIATVKCTGNRYDYFDPWNYPTEKTKCIKRNQIIYKNSIQISKWNLQDWYSNSDSGNGLLWNFHGINSYGFRVWSRSSCSPESRRAD